METRSSPTLVMMRSSLPSASRSLKATSSGSVEVPYVVFVNEIAPAGLSLINTVNDASLIFTAIASALPSPSRSPVVIGPEVRPVLKSAEEGKDAALMAGPPANVRTNGLAD